MERTVGEMKWLSFLLSLRTLETKLGHTHISTLYTYKRRIYQIYIKNHGFWYYHENHEVEQTSGHHISYGLQEK